MKISFVLGKIPMAKQQKLIIYLTMQINNAHFPTVNNFFNGIQRRSIIMAIILSMLNKFPTRYKFLEMIPGYEMIFLTIHFLGFLTSARV